MWPSDVDQCVWEKRGQGGSVHCLGKSWGLMEEACPHVTPTVGLERQLVDKNGQASLVSGAGLGVINRKDQRHITDSVGSNQCR